MSISEVHRSLDELKLALDDGLLSVVSQPDVMWDEAVAIAARVTVHLRTQDALHAMCELRTVS